LRGVGNLGAEDFCSSIIESLLQTLILSFSGMIQSLRACISLFESLGHCAQKSEGLLGRIAFFLRIRKNVQGVSK
jgi:hypothetical protein